MALLKFENKVDFIFYSDFTNYDSNTRVETPIIGEPGTYQANIYIYRTYDSGGPFNKKYAIIMYGYDWQQMTNKYRIIQLRRNLKSVTTEFWIKQTSTRTNSLYINCSGGYGMILDMKIHVGINLRSSNATVNLYNGSRLHSVSTTTHKLIITTFSGDVWRHIAIVENSTGTSVYVSGVLVAKSENDTPAEFDYNERQLPIYGTGSSGSTGCAYFSLRNGDHSNNGESFTVPTEPYM